MKERAGNGLRMDSHHNADIAVSASPTGSLEQKCPRFSFMRVLTGQKQTGPIHTIITLSHCWGPLQEEHDLGSKA